MGNRIKQIWDQLAAHDERLATDGFNACEGNVFARPVGTRESVAEFFTPVSGQWFLDVGCGWGKMLIPCMRAGMKTVGADISTVMLSKLRERLGDTPGRLRLVNADASALPFATNCFDVVWCHSVLMHLSDEAAEQAISELARVMKPSGRGYLHFRNSYNPMDVLGRFSNLFQWIRAKKASPIRRRSYSLPEIRRLLARHFRIVDIWVESFQLFPVVIPDHLLASFASLQTGIPSSAIGRYRPLGSENIARGLTSLFDVLRRLSNGPVPALKLFGKEFVAVVQRKAR